MFVSQICAGMEFLVVEDDFGNGFSTCSYINPIFEANTRHRRPIREISYSPVPGASRGARSGKYRPEAGLPELVCMTGSDRSELIKSHFIPTQ